MTGPLLPGPSPGPLRGLRGRDAGSFFLAEKSVPHSHPGPGRNPSDFTWGGQPTAGGRLGSHNQSEVWPPGPEAQGGTWEDLPTPVKVKGLATPS